MIVMPLEGIGMRAMTNGEKIKQLRLKYKLTQAQFADKVGVKTGTVFAWEHGHINLTPERLNSIGRQFDVTLVELSLDKDAPLGEQIQTLRIQHSLSQSKLAAQIGIKSATVSRWEHGLAKPNQRMLVRLNEFFGASLVFELKSKKKCDFSSHLGKKLTRLRIDAKVSQKALGQAVGVDDTSISAWETGKHTPSEANLNKLCQYFKVTPAEMMSKGG